MTKYIKYLLFIVLLPVLGQPGTPQKVQHTALEIKQGIAYYKSEPYSGYSVLLWDNKRINQTFNWIDGKQNGKYEEFTEEGVLVAAETWENGRKNGPFHYHYPNGALKSHGNFYLEELNGKVIGYWPNRIVRYVKIYENGVKKGPSRTFFSDGDPEQVANFVNDVPDGVVTSYYHDSIVSNETEYRMGVRHGHFYKFHKNGCPGEESYYKNGMQDSVSHSWEEINCKLLKQGNYLNGDKHGQFVEFGFLGDTLSIITYQNGKLHGRYKKWQDKEAETEGYYTNGLTDGFWRYGLSSKFEPREGRYDEGVMVGLWKHFDVDGYLLFDNLFDDEGKFKKQKFYKRKLKYKLRD